MPISMDDALKGFAENTRNIVKAKRENQNSLMDTLLAKAKIAEAGYDINGDEISERPEYISSKQASAKKDLAEAGLAEMKLERMKRASLGGQGGIAPLAGGQPLGSGVPEGYKSYLDPNTGDEKIVKDLSVAPPMNEAQKFILSEKQKLAEESDQKKKFAQEDAAEALKSNIQTVEDVKKGSKYFGPLGNLPSWIAPSSLQPGEWGKRREWEANIDKLKANKVLEVMTQLKNASRTGATGFGALNQSELQLLKDSAASLQQRDLPSEVAMKHLDTIEKLQRKALGRMGQQSSDIQTGDMVSMTAPDGTQVQVHKSNIEKARQRGLK